MEEKNVVVPKIKKEPEVEAKSDMKKKIVILVILLLCVGSLIALVAFRSGLPIVDFWTITGGLDTVETEIKSVKKIAENIGARMSGEGVLALYEKSDAEGRKTQTVVHILNGEPVFSVTDTDTVKNEVVLHNSNGTGWYAVTSVAGSGSSALYSIRLYNEKGEPFAKKEDMHPAVYDGLQYVAVLDLVRLDREVFRVSRDGTVRSAFHLDAFSELPDFQRKVDDYYYVFAQDCCYIYDEKAVLTATYHIPSAGQDAKFFVLSDGTLLAQYITFEGEHMDDYTFAEGGQKYTLHQVLVSARNGSRTQLEDPEFYFASILSDEDELRRRGLNTGIDNLAEGYYIENALLDTSAHCLSAVLLSNRGRITSTVGDVIPAMHGGRIFGVVKNRWVAKNLAGEHFLLNEWGSVVGSFPDPSATEVTIAEKLFVCDYRIYDWDLNLLYDMEENAVFSYMLVGSSVVMYKEDGETLLFEAEKKEAIPLIAAGTDQRVSVLGSSLLAIEQTVDGKKQYAIYSSYNVHLITLEAVSLFAQSYDVDGERIVELLAVGADSNALYLATVEDKE